MTKFIGQSRIWKELDIILPELKKGKNANFLFKAPTGMGKTTLALALANDIYPYSIWYELPDDEGKVSPNYNHRIIILDEVHLMKNQESIYPEMDKRNHIFFLCSNKAGKLNDALVRRCIPFYFEDYTEKEMRLVIREFFNQEELDIPSFLIPEIVKNTNGTPGSAKILVERLSYIFRVKGIPNNTKILRDYIVNILGIEDGLTPEHRIYLEWLEKLDRASLTTLVSVTGYDKDTITDIEKTLLDKDLIQYTSRGRILKKKGT